MGEAFFLKSVCWNITKLCNDSCGFCYRDSVSTPLSLEQNKIILKHLIEHGVEKVSFVGGEPLLYNELFQLVEYGKRIKQNMIFSLTTNAISLVSIDGENRNYNINQELLQKITEWYDWITLSLEGASPLSQEAIGRNSYHFLRIIALLEYLKMTNNPLKIKINTMVCKQNIQCLQEIAELLLHYNVKRWKLMRFLPSRFNAKTNISQYELDDETYSFFCSKLHAQKHLTEAIRITEDCQTDYIKSYANISPDGQLVSFDGLQYIKVINIYKGLNNKINNFIDIHGHINKRTHFMGL